MKTIYKIICKKNNRMYIGQTKHYDVRKREHINDLKANRHSNVYLQEDFNKYGISQFTFEIIEEVPNNIGNNREDYWMSYYGGIDTDSVYNSMNSFTKSIYMKNKLHNYYVGKSHIELHGEEVAERMRKANSMKHTGKKASYTPYKGKVKSLDGDMVEITETLYNQVLDLKKVGYKMTEISKITNIKYNGIYNIVNNKIYLPFKCND